MPLCRERPMNEFFEFLSKMGGMHDSEVSSIQWRPIEGRIEIAVEDLYANFDGFPEYPGKESGVIALLGVRQLLMSLENHAKLRIFEFLPVENERDTALIRFSPSGSIRVHFTSAEYPKCRL